MKWSITIDHRLLPTYHVPTNKFAYPGVYKEGYLPYLFRTSTHIAVMYNYSLFAAVYYPFVEEVFELNDCLIYALREVPDDRAKLLVDHGLFSFAGLEYDPLVPFMGSLTDNFSMPCTINHTQVDGEDTTIIRRFINPKVYDDAVDKNSVMEYILGKYVNVVIVDYDQVIEEHYVGHVDDTVLLMNTGSVSNNFDYFNINEFIRQLSLDISFGVLDEFTKFAKLVTDTSKRSTAPKKKEKKKRRFDKVS